MIIRQAVIHDAPRMAELGALFWGETIYGRSGFQYSYEKATDIAEMAIQYGVAFVLEDDGIRGLILCAYGPMPFSDGLAATEIVFFVEEGKRGYGHLLMQAAEEKAAEYGADVLIMTSISGGTQELAERLYHSFGYKKSETVFLKRL